MQKPADRATANGNALDQHVQLTYELWVILEALKGRCEASIKLEAEAISAANQTAAVAMHAIRTELLTVSVSIFAALDAHGAVIPTTTVTQ